MWELGSDTGQWLGPIFIYVLRVAGAAATVFVTRRIARVAGPRLQPVLARADLSPSMAMLTTTATYYAIWVLGIMTALVVLGIPVDSVLMVAVAVLLVLGIALQQSLRDLAATINFILFKHFEQGDLIETNGILGTVQEIELLNTTLVKADRKLAVLPNGKIQQNGLLNYSKLGVLRVDLVVTISYEDDLLRAKEVIAHLLSEDARILAEPPPMIVVLELADNGVNIGVRPFVNASDYWQVGWDLTEALKLRFDKEGITIPYPQRDVHMRPVSDQSK